MPSEYAEILHSPSLSPTEAVNLAATSTRECLRRAGLSYDVSVIVDGICDATGRPSEDPKLGHPCTGGPNECMGLDVAVRIRRHKRGSDDHAAVVDPKAGAI